MMLYEANGVKRMRVFTLFLAIHFPCSCSDDLKLTLVSLHSPTTSLSLPLLFCLLFWLKKVRQMEEARRRRNKKNNDRNTVKKTKSTKSKARQDNKHAERQITKRRGFRKQKWDIESVGYLSKAGKAAATWLPSVVARQRGFCGFGPLPVGRKRIA